MPGVDASFETRFLCDDLDPVGDPYGVMLEPDDPEEAERERCAELRARYADRWNWFGQKNKRANRRACSAR